MFHTILKFGDLDLDFQGLISLQTSKLEKVFKKKNSCGFIRFKTVLYTHILIHIFSIK